MIIHEHKFIFVHVPRTGGTSLEKAFMETYPYLPPKHPFPEGKHNPYSHYLRDRYKDCNKIYKSAAFIRNPWSRVVSHYRYVHNMTGDHHPLWVYGTGTFKEFVVQVPFIIDKVRYMLPLIYYISTETNPVAVDYVGRFENYKEDLTLISKIFGFSHVKIPHWLDTQGKDDKTVWDYYTDDESKEIVYDCYKKDIELFGYSFGSGSTKNNISTMGIKI
jgi:hypothetical protein